MQKPVLVLIDIQNDYFPGGAFPLDQPLAAAKQAAGLLSRFRASGLPIFHVQHLCGEGASFFLRGTPGCAIHAQVAPLPAEPVFVKTVPNSFHETGLYEAYRQSGADGMVVCGMMTQMCVDTTVRAARDYGIPVTLIGDACAARAMVWREQEIPAPTVQAAFLAALQGSFAAVMTAADYLERMG